MENDQSALAETIIAGGESYYAEFKSAWHYGPTGRQPRDLKEVAKDIARTIVAFANSDGGDLLLGVEDDGTETGIPWQGDALRYLVAVPESHLLGGEDLGVQTRTVHLHSQTILWFRVPDHGTGPVTTSDGTCLWRRGARSEPVSPKEIGQRRDHVLGDLAYESAPVPQATLDDLDPDLLHEHLLFQVAPRWVPGTALERLAAMPAESLLRYWSLAEVRNGDVVLRRAALLLFAREPLRWHPNNRLRLRRVHRSEEGFGRLLGTREREIQGPIVSILRQATSLLLETLATEARTDQLFSTTQLLPRDTVEECIVNAVAHRNYAVEGQAIEVLLYPERVEVRSPGRLPEPITIRDLLAQRGVHRSRNPVIMRVLRDLRWSRDQGEGMRRIFGSMRQVELDVPELEETADTFIVRLSTRSIYDEQTLAWIASYGPFGLLPDDRKYLVQLREAGGSLSVDKLARQLDESFDETKKHLTRLEKQGLIWHRHKSRTYHAVESANVPHERAFRAFREASLPLEHSTILRREDIQRVAGVADQRGFDQVIAQWQPAGILQPAGSGRWRFGPSFMEYCRQRI